MRLYEQICFYCCAVIDLGQKEKIDDNGDRSPWGTGSWYTDFHVVRGEKLTYPSDELWKIIYEDYTKLNPFLIKEYSIKATDFAAASQLDPDSDCV